MDEVSLDPRLQRIAAVTRAYPAMRRAIVAAPSIPALVMLLRAYHNGGTVTGLLLWAGVEFACIVASEYVLGRFITRRFGSVVEVEMAEGWRKWIPGIVAGLYSTLNKVDAWVIRSGGPSLVISFLAAVALWVTIQYWPARKHMAAVVVVCAAAAGAVPVLAVGDAFNFWRANCESVALAAWMLSGVGDLVVLHRWFPRKDEALRAEV